MTPRQILLFSGAVLLLLLCGCMHDQPASGDTPWATPANWEGTIPLPNAFQND